MIDTTTLFMDPISSRPPSKRAYLRRVVPFRDESRHGKYRPGTEAITIRTARERIARWKYTVMVLTCESRTAAGRVWDTVEEAQAEITREIRLLPHKAYRKAARWDRTPVECEVCGKWHLSNEHETTLNAWGAEAMDVYADAILRGKRVDRALLAKIEGRMRRVSKARDGG